MWKRLVILMSVVALVGCDHDERINRLEKETKQLREDLRKEQASSDFDLQAKCAKDSRAWFNENWHGDKDTILLAYTNHYNKSQNKCFILVEYHYNMFVNTWTNHMSLWDVYENEKYGDFALNTTSTFKPTYQTTESVITCEVYGKKCTTTDGFNGLVQPYLNN